MSERGCTGIMKATESRIIGGTMTTRVKKAVWLVVILAAFVLGISALAHWIGDSEERLERDFVDMSTGYAEDNEERWERDFVDMFNGYAEDPEFHTVIMVSYVPGLTREIAQDENIQRMLLPQGKAKGPAPCPGIMFLITSDFRTDLMKLYKRVPINEWVDEVYFNKLNPNRENFSFMTYDEESVTLLTAKDRYRTDYIPPDDMEKWTKRISIKEFKRRYPEQIILREAPRDAREKPGKVHIIGMRVVFGRPDVNFEQFKNMLTADGVVMGITHDESSVEIHAGPEAIERLVSRALSLKSY